jgi:hypothetical protein
LRRSGPELSEKRLATLETLVASISCEEVFGLDFRTAGQLRLDRSRFNEITEAWVPVQTPHGPGVLCFENCD